MRILVTGGTGFIGSALVKALAPEHELTVLGRTQPAVARGSLVHVRCNLAHPGELAALATAGGLPERIDAVVHLAVSRQHRGFPDAALDMFELHVAAAAHLLDYARRAGASRFVLGSTGSVYGAGAASLKEDARLKPESYFPASKHAAELLADSYRALFDCATLRYFTPFGPGQTDRLIPTLIDRVVRGADVLLPPEGDGIRFAATYIDDCVEVIARALRESWSGTFNVAGPDVLTIRSAAEIIGKAVGRAPRFARDASAGAQLLVPDLSALHARMSTDHFTDFATGVQSMIAAEAR